MEKRPAFQFYPGDWRRDTPLQSCSLASRGLWLEMMNLMHDGTPYGHLQVNEKTITPPLLARMVGAEVKELQPLLVELGTAGVFSRTKNGVIFSRRMVRDEDLRIRRGRHGYLSQQHESVPKLKDLEKVSIKDTSKDTLEDTLAQSFDRSFGGSPASASASASAEKKEKDKEKDTRANGARGFALFWKNYPKKKGKGGCETWWKKNQPDDVLLGIMLAKIGQEQRSSQWQKLDGNYIPFPATWLKQRRWEDDNGYVEIQSCQRRVMPAGERFLRECGKPAVERVGRNQTPRCADCLKESKTRRENHGHTEAATV